MKTEKALSKHFAEDFKSRKKQDVILKGGIMKVLMSVFSAFLILTMAASAAPLPDTDTIPPSLDPWKAWVLHGEEKRFCPTSYNDGETFRCVWPSALDLDLDRNGGRFNQQWLVVVEGRVPLPGSETHWPLNVKVDEKPVPVVKKNGMPSVLMTPGRHRVEGTFVWHALPEMIRIPAKSGLVNLSVDGRKIDFPQLDSNGRLWLQNRKQSPAEQDRLDIRVCRLVNDTIPMRISTLFQINVSGRAREITLQGALPEHFIPLSLDSRLPARISPEGELFVQARPGRWEIRVMTRSKGPVQSVKPARMPYGEEIWAFQSQNQLRMVKVEGVPSVDATRTDIPENWKRFPAFIVRPGDQMRFKEIRRGDPEPAPDQISLKRTWWLDFDGKGFTIRDRITGTMSRQWYLAMNPPAILGRVSVDGSDQLITLHGKDQKPGVELRKGRLDLVAESRFEASAKDVPAVGWDHDFESVTGVLNLPPGWRLLTVDGVDAMPGTWFSRWTLLDLFLVLIISLSVWRLWNWRWGLLALLAVGLTWHEPGSPHLVWLHLLAAAALLRFMPEGWMRKIITLWSVGSFITLVALAIPFIVHQVRWGIYPQLEPVASHVRLQARQHETAGQAMDKAMPPLEDLAAKKMPSRIKSYVSSGAYTRKRVHARQQALMIQDPNALIQTGPGLPRWKWRSFRMKWNGPVEKSQQIHMWMLSPAVNLVLCFVRVFLLAFLIFRFTGFLRWKLPQTAFSFAAVLVCVLLIPGIAAGETRNTCYPPDTILKTLKQRLLEKPDCLPDCAESPQMKLTVDPDRVMILFKIHAAIETAVPLPGSLDLWRPARVLMDGSPAAGLMRDKGGLLWVLVPAGIHTATLIGHTPAGSSFRLPLAFKPRKVIVQSDGWQVEGINPEGRVEGGIKLIRTRQTSKDDFFRSAGTLPPFLRVERMLSLGLTWKVRTTVRRVSPAGTPVVVSVPLISGEAVTTAGVNVLDEQVQVNMDPGVREIRWDSTLQQKNVIKLKAPEDVPWTETWVLDVSPVWHCETAGIPVIHHQESGHWRPQWQPWPGEEVLISVSRPEAVPGQTVTIDAASLTLSPGKRFCKADLSLKIRSSRGGQHKIVLPGGIRLQQVKISGKTLPIREQGRDLIVPLRPGSQDVEVNWHRNSALSIAMRAPAVGIGKQAVNADVVFQMPGNRWILLTGGPRLGPAVLFWSYLLVIVIASIALGRVPWTPLRTGSWLLLGLGLTQVHPLVSIMIVGWLLVLGMRGKNPLPGGWLSFNAGQIILVFWTLAALSGLYVAIQTGLLGIPNMQISGNDSSAFRLHWTQDRIGALMPMPWVISLPLFVYRILMLLWALWLASSLLKWLRWGWRCFGEGGLWKKAGPRGKKVRKAAEDPVPDPDASSG